MEHTHTLEIPVEGEIVNVGKLNNIAKRLLERHCPFIWVQGEISNLSRPNSGHLYFTLKDASAQVRCVFFRHYAEQQLHLEDPLQNGTEVLVHAKVTLYEARGDYQLLVYSLTLAGEGVLQKRLLALQKKLEEEGIFHLPKKPLPTMPMTIGVVTSTTGAAIRDVLSVLKRRFPLADVWIYPCSVQGVQALPSILAALQSAFDHQTVEVLVLVRGGGSLEDLFAYNEEALVRMVAHSPLPIVTGVGHETDTTLVDYAASKRAPTPSAAAELISPDRLHLLKHLGLVEKQLIQYFWFYIEEQQQRLDTLEQQLQDPRIALKQQAEKTTLLSHRLYKAMHHCLRYAGHPLAHLQQQLQHLSPLATLARGYSIVKTRNNTIVTDGAEITPGTLLSILLHNATLSVKVIENKKVELKHDPEGLLHQEPSTA